MHTKQIQLRQSDLEKFAATNPTGYIKIVLDDGSIVVGKNFQYFPMGEKLNLWQIKPDDKVGRMVDGFSIMEIREM